MCAMKIIAIKKLKHVKINTSNEGSLVYGFHGNLRKEIHLRIDATCKKRRTFSYIFNSSTAGDSLIF